MYLLFNAVSVVICSGRMRYCSDMFLFLDPSDELVENGFNVREEDVLYNWAEK